jgi:hypothetical protein
MGNRRSEPHPDDPETRLQTEPALPAINGRGRAGGLFQDPAAGRILRSSTPKNDG